LRTGFGLVLATNGANVRGTSGTGPRPAQPEDWG